MKAKKAVEILEGLPHTLNNDPDYEQREAIKLGAEALKIVVSSRQVGSVIITPLLPGETPEEEEE